MERSEAGRCKSSPVTQRFCRQWLNRTSVLSEKLLGIRCCDREIRLPWELVKGVPDKLQLELVGFADRGLHLQKICQDGVSSDHTHEKGRGGTRGWGLKLSPFRFGPGTLGPLPRFRSEGPHLR